MRIHQNVANYVNLFKSVMFAFPGEGSGSERLLVPGRDEAGGHRPFEPVNDLCGHS